MHDAASARRAGIIMALVLSPGIAAAAPIWVGRFDTTATEIPAPWRVEMPNRNAPPTRYRLRLWDGVPAIEAHAAQSMALLARPLAIDLAATPVLCWRWRVDAPLKSADMNTKAGDDYAARVYLSFAVPPDTLGAGERLALGAARMLYGGEIPDAALNYLWDNRHPIGTWQANAYTDRARMLVLRSGAGDAGRWVSERRDVGADFRRAFGHAPQGLTGLALASDTDNTGETAHAGFADFRFVAAGDDCR
ncbi:MAG: DUF3047 domain-containing protein [Rhodocyclales bacterium]|nr:DUF3047 domain-containing protein [Rhodocyclales bacterium]